MDVIGDLVARERRSESLAVRTDSRSGSLSYDAFCTTTWKTGNLLRHYGVRDDATVAIDAGDTESRPTPKPLLAFVGATLLGATVRFDPPAEPDARALVAPVDRLARYDPAPGTQVIAYGDAPETPGVAHFEAETWSENPTEPPDAVEPDAVALATDEASFAHERLLTAADRLVDEFDLGAESEVALRAPLSAPGTVVAGVVAPLVAGGTVLLDRDRTGSIAVARRGDGAAERATEAAEATVIDPGEIL